MNSLAQSIAEAAITDRVIDGSLEDKIIRAYLTHQDQEGVAQMCAIGHTLSVAVVGRTFWLLVAASLGWSDTRYWAAAPVNFSKTVTSDDSQVMTAMKELVEDLTMVEVFL